MSSPSQAPHPVFCLISDERVFAFRSTAVFRHIIDKMQIPASYVPFQVEAKQLGHAIASLRVLHIAGANVAVPYKEAVIPYMDALSESANIIGAVNTIAIKNNQAKGYNTNAIGIMDALEDAGFAPAGKTALILGAGGAAKAVAFVLQWLKAERIYIAGRNRDRAASVASRSGGVPLSFGDLADAPMQAELLVNATSISSAAESPEMDKFSRDFTVDGCELVFDLNYGREPNIWQALARDRDIAFMDGLSPLVHHARNSLALWTSREINAADIAGAINAKNPYLLLHRPPKADGP